MLGGNIIASATQAALALAGEGGAAGPVAARYGAGAAQLAEAGAIAGMATGAGALPGAEGQLGITPPGGPGLTSLGITASGEIAIQDGAELGVQALATAGRWATGMGAAKLAFDGLQFLRGFAACHQ